MKIAVISLMSLLLCFSPAAVLHAATNEIFTFGVGEFTVSMLSEMQGERSPDILIGASEEDIAKFAATGNIPFAMAAFLIQSPDGAFLVDTGVGNLIPGHLKSLGVEMEDIEALFITHSHRDHIGGMLTDERPAFPNAKVFVSKPEYDWSEQLRETLGKYDGKYETMIPGTLESGGRELAKGIYAAEAYGHTPGHTMFMLNSGGEKLLIWGDLTHAMAVQMPRPGVSVTFDADPEAAAAAREKVLKFAADNEIPVAGMHIAFPGVGDVVPDADNPGGYKFVPKS